MTTALSSGASTSTSHFALCAPLLAPLGDPLGFEAGDTNLFRYVGNHPTMATDPSGLAEGWEWNWHHLLDQAIFNEDFMTRHGLRIYPNSAEYGWMLRAKDHTWTGGIHPDGWSQDWKRWIGHHEAKGTTITKEMIDEQLKNMITKYKLNERGFAAKFCYEQADDAYKIAERMARRRAAQEAAELAGKAGRKAMGELAEDVAKTGRKGRIASRLAKIPIIGFFVGVFAGTALGDEDALINAIEPIGFGAATMGDGEINWADIEQRRYEDWLRYQNELSQRWAERQRLAGGIDALVRDGLRFENCPAPVPVSNPSRSSLYGTR